MVGPGTSIGECLKLLTLPTEETRESFYNARDQFELPAKVAYDTQDD